MVIVGNADADYRCYWLCLLACIQRGLEKITRRLTTGSRSSTPSCKGCLLVQAMERVHALYHANKSGRRGTLLPCKRWPPVGVIARIFSLAVEHTARP